MDINLEETTHAPNNRPKVRQSSRDSVVIELLSDDDDAHEQARQALTQTKVLLAQKGEGWRLTFLDPRER